jgi:pimeloyl-ACP methyl ester carboxylesterase
MPDPEAAFAQVTGSLRRSPLVITEEDGTRYEITYAGFVHDVLLAMYLPEAVEQIPALVELLQQMISARSSTSARQSAASRYSVTMERAERWRQRQAADPMLDPASTQLANDYELNAAVVCSDSRNPASTRRWSTLADRVDRQAPYFGRFWLWNSAVCARSHWTARDEDAYQGRFDRRTAGPVLVVGNYYDPATHYDAAVSVARRLPNSRLLSSDSWGHTAYGTSGCATSAVDDFLIATRLPRAGTVCLGDVQPFR